MIINNRNQPSLWRVEHLSSDKSKTQIFHPQTNISNCPDPLPRQGVHFMFNKALIRGSDKLKINSSFRAKKRFSVTTKYNFILFSTQRNTPQSPRQRGK